MPSHRPLRGEVWVKRVYSNANQKPDSEEAKNHTFLLGSNDAQFVDHRAASRGKVNGWKRVKVTNVSGTQIEYIYPVPDIGDAWSGHSVSLASFLEEWTYQNPYMYPQIGSLWIRNNTHVPTSVPKVDASMRELGGGNQGPDKPVILYIVRGVNTTRYDCDNGAWLRGSPGNDECTVRIYNTNGVDNVQRRGISNVDWSGGLSLDLPYIRQDFESWSTQGGNSSEGRPLGWRVKRNKLKTYYTYVGIAPEYLDSIDIPLDITHRMVPKVGQIFKVKTGDLTHGQMVTSVAWSRDYRDMHAYANYDSSALNAPGFARRGLSTRYLPLFGTFPVLPNEVPNAPQNERDYHKTVHYPNDNPTLIVTTVQVFDLNRDSFAVGNDWSYWGDRAYMWEIKEFNELFRLATLNQGDFGVVLLEMAFQKNHIIRYRQMIKSCLENESRQPSNFTGFKGGLFPPPNTLSETKEWFEKKPKWWPKNKVWTHYQWEMPRLGQMLISWNGKMVRVVYISEDQRQIITFSSDGQELQYANDLARNFWKYHQELTSLKLDFISLKDKKKELAQEEFKKSLVYNDWEIRKLKSTSYVMALPNNLDKSTNAMLTVHGPLILINEFRNYIFNVQSTSGNNSNASTTTSKGRNYPIYREKENYDAVIAQMFGSTDKDTRPFGGNHYSGRLQIVRRTIRREPGEKYFWEPWHDFKPHVLTHVQRRVNMLTVGSVWKWNGNMDVDYKNANTIQGGFPSQDEIIVLGPALDPGGGMRELEKGKEHCLWVVNRYPRYQYCGVYTMPVGYLLLSYNFEGHASRGFSMHSISRQTVLNLALLHDLSDTAENGAQFRDGEVSYEKFTIMLPPNAVENYFPKTGEVWHHKIVPQFKKGPPPKGTTQELAWTENFIGDDVSLDTSALNYVQWPLLNGTFRARPSEYYYMHNRSSDVWQRGDLYQYLGDYSQRISDTMTFDQKFQLLMRAKKYRVEVGQVFLNWRAGRLYYVSRTIKNNGKVGGYEFKVLHERTQKQRPDDDAPLFTSISLAHATDSTKWESLCFLGWINWSHWRHVDKPISGSIYKLDPVEAMDDGTNGWKYDYSSYKGLYPRERRPRVDPLRNFWKKYKWLQKKTGIVLNLETEVEVLGTGPNDRNNGPPTVEFKFVIKNIPDDNIYKESMTLTEEDFHMLFIYRAPQAYVPFFPPEYLHHITFLEERKAAQARDRNKTSNRQRNEQDALNRHEYTCMICFEWTTDPSQYIYEREQEQFNLEVTAPEEKVVGQEMTVDVKLPDGRTEKVKLLPEVRPGEKIVEQTTIYVENKEEPPIGYLFTHDHTGLSEPHILCGRCALGLLKADNIYDNQTNRALVNPNYDDHGSPYMPRDIAPNANTKAVQDITMGGRDNNNVAVGPIFPYKIKCPTCSIYYNWRRLKIVMARNSTRKRESSGSSSSKRQVWGELDNLKLKF